MPQAERTPQHRTAASPNKSPEQTPSPASGSPPQQQCLHSDMRPLQLTELEASNKGQAHPSILRKHLPLRVLPTSTSARTWTEAKVLWTRCPALQWQASSYIPYGHDSLAASSQSQHSADRAYKQPILANRDSSIQRSPNPLESSDQSGWLSPWTLAP